MDDNKMDSKKLKVNEIARMFAINLIFSLNSAPMPIKLAAISCILYELIEVHHQQIRTS